MENKEEILNALEEFGRLPTGTAVPSLLEHYLTRVAATGVTVFPWCKIKPLLLHKLDLVLKEFQERAPSECTAACPNVDNVKFDDMHKLLLSAVDQFSGTPFTIQRICELVTDPMKHYKRADKFMRGVEKNLSVVTTVDSFGNRIVSESKTLVNGLDPALEQSGLDRTSSDLSFVDPSASPYVPSAPVNSPATASGSGGSWFSSLTSVVDSPNSYPNWHANNDAVVPPLTAAGASLSMSGGSWPLSAFDGDDEPPAKRRMIAPLSDSSDAGDLSAASPPVIAPLLGQLLSSSPEASHELSNGNADASEVIIAEKMNVQEATTDDGAADDAKHQEVVASDLNRTEVTPDFTTEPSDVDHETSGVDEPSEVGTEILEPKIQLPDGYSDSGLSTGTASADISEKDVVSTSEDLLDGRHSSDDSVTSTDVDKSTSYATLNVSITNGSDCPDVSMDDLTSPHLDTDKDTTVCSNSKTDAAVLSGDACCSAVDKPEVCSSEPSGQGSAADVSLVTPDVQTDTD